MKYLWILGSFLLAVGCASSPPRTENARSFDSKMAGFAMNVPPGWHFATMKTLDENRSNVRLNDPELEKALQSNVTAPLLVVTKYPEPHPALNPAIQVILRPLATLKGNSPTEILSLVTTPLEKAFSGFEYLQKPTKVTISGLDAAHVRANYIAKNADGGEFPVTARMWLVPRGSMMFLIGMTGPQRDPDSSEQEFQAAYDSIVVATD